MRTHWLPLSGALLCSVLLFAGCRRDGDAMTTTSEEARSAYLQGVTLYESFYYAEAKQSFQAALAADSGFALAWGRLALVHWRSDKEKTSQTIMARALAAAATATPREQLLIRLWDHWMHYRVDAGLAVADSLIRLNSQEKEAYLIRGFLYEAAQNFKASIESYQKAISVDSVYALAVMSLGYAYSYAGDQEKAIEYMQRYIRLAPGAADPRASYGDLLLWAGRYDEALEQYAKSLELKPDYWYAFGRTGEIFMLLGRLRDARAQYERAQHALSTVRDSMSDMTLVDARIEMSKGNYPQAVELLRKGMTDDTVAGGRAVALAYALAKGGKLEEARATLGGAFEEIRERRLDSTAAACDLYRIAAVIENEGGNGEQALADCRTALEICFPRSRGLVYTLMADIYLRQRNYEAGLDACEEALRASPNLPLALLTLTKIYHAKGDVKMTVEIGSRLLALWKDADPDFRMLNELRRILGQRVPT